MEKKLLAAIYKHPRDDDARRVYADLLQERGDPRGEFIALQLAPSPSAKDEKRAKSLLKTHGKAWLEALDGALVEKSITWARGFPVAGRINGAGALWKKGRGAALARVEALQTIEALDLSAPNTVYDDKELWKVIKALPHLRAAHGLPRALLVALAGGKPHAALETVECVSWGSDEKRDAAQKRALADGMHDGALPALTTLKICWRHGRDMPEDFTWVPHTKLRTLRVDGYYLGSQLPAWHAWLKKLPAGAVLEQVELRHSHEDSEHFISLTMRRSEGKLTLSGVLRREMDRNELSKVLQLPGVVFERVDVK